MYMNTSMDVYDDIIDKKLKIIKLCERTVKHLWLRQVTRVLYVPVPLLASQKFPMMRLHFYI